MGQSVSVYFGNELLKWINDEAARENRSRSNFIENVLSDLKQGKLIPADAGSPEIRKTRLPPSART